MAKRGKRSLVRDDVLNRFPYIFLSFIGYLALIVSAIFIIVGFGVESWDLLSSASFWTVINSCWIGALLAFYFADRMR